MPDFIFYIDKSKNPRYNPIVSDANGQTDDSKLTFVAGDKLDVGVVFVDNNGIDTTMATGSNKKYLDLAIGSVGVDSPLTNVTNWYLSSSYGYTGSLNLLPLTASVGTSDSVNLTMQLVVTGSTGTKQTVLLRSVTILNPVDVI